jgi:hypothetical protein
MIFSVLYCSFDKDNTSAGEFLEEVEGRLGKPC